MPNRGCSEPRRVLSAFDIWFSTVFTDIPSSSAISVYVRPSRLLSKNISLQRAGRRSIAFHTSASRTDVSISSSDTSAAISAATELFLARIREIAWLRTAPYIYALKLSGTVPCCTFCHTETKASCTASSVSSMSSSILRAYMHNGMYMVWYRRSNGAW